MLWDGMAVYYTLHQRITFEDGLYEDGLRALRMASVVPLHPSYTDQFHHMHGWVLLDVTGWMLLSLWMDAIDCMGGIDDVVYY